MEQVLFFRVEERTRLHHVCSLWRTRHLDAYKRISTVVKERFGADALLLSPDQTKVLGLEAVKPIPPGWRISPVRSGGRVLMVPYKTTQGFEAREFLKGLPTLPSYHEIAEAINAPSAYRYSYRASDGDITHCSGAIGGFTGPAHLGWAGKILIIQVYNPEYYLREARSDPSAKVIAGEWTPPPSLIPITEIESKYIYARNAYYQEKKEQRAKHATQEVKIHKSKVLRTANPT